MGKTHAMLIEEAEGLPDPEVNLLTHNEQMLIDLAKDLAKALKQADIDYLDLQKRLEIRAFNAD